MKKRLLSAALALAMVLTLIPATVVPAFATTYSGNSGVSSVTYYTLGQTITVAGKTETIPSAGWYETNTLTAVDSGVVASSGNSGTWFSTVANAMGASQTYIKLLGDATDSGPLYVDRGMTLDVNGHAAGNIDWMINGSYQLTLCDTSVTAATTSVKAAGKTITLNGAGIGAATVILSDVSVTGITLNGEGTTSLAQKVTLNGAQVTQAVDLDGNGSTLTLNPSTKTSVFTSIGGAVTMDAASGLALNAMTGSTRGTFQFGNTVTITQTGAGGQVNFGSQYNGGTVTGAFKLTSPSGGTVTAYNTTFTAGAELTGYGTNFSATSCNIQDDGLIVGGVNATTTLTDSQKTSLAAPTVTIVGGNVAYIGAPASWNEQLTRGYTVSISGNARVASAGFNNASVTVTSSEIGTTKGVILKNGTLTLTGDGSDAGDITLGATGYGSATLNVTGTNVTTGKILTAASNARTVSVNIPTSDTNYFAQLGADSTGVLENGSAVVKGGKFGAAVKVEYLDNSLQFQVEDTNNGKVYVYYGTTATDMNNLVAAYQKAADAEKFVVTPVHDGTGSTTADFQLADGTTKDANGKDAANIVLKITFKTDKAQTFTLPTWVNNRQVSVWTKENDANVQRNGGATYMTSDSATFNAQEGSYSLTKLTNVAVDSTKSNLNPGVTAILTGNTIKLSGNVTEGGTATIPLVLTTDNGDKVDINVGWNGTVTNFSSKAEPDVLNVVDNGVALQVVNSSVKYTLDGSGLRRQVEKLNIGSGQITTTVATSVPGTILYRENLGKAMSSTADDSFDFSKSGAVSEAFGRVIATITDANIISWRTTAQDTAWRGDGNTGTPTGEQRQNTGYYDVWIVPYLNVNVTSIDNSGLMTATMEPYYRIEVRATGKEPIVVQTGRTMGVLSGDMGKVSVKLPVEDAFQAGFGTGAKAGYAHQNATYVYEVTGAKAVTTSGSEAPANVSFEITHAANSGNGFGTIVLNKVAPLIKLEDKDSNALGTYDALQAAVNDAENTDKITVDAAYKGDRTINVTGVARTFQVDAKGPDGIKVSNSIDTVSWQNDGGLYTVQLLRNNAVVTPTGNVTISVATATNGRGAVSASSGKAGDTITVTSTPNSGYNASGLTIRTDKGATVSYTTVGTNSSTNVTTYTFKIPEGATTVTVTPAFAAKAPTGATVTVANSTTYGTAVTSAGTNVVPAGTAVTVTTVPGTGYRTMELIVSTNVGNITATRTGTNSFVFNVPNGATNVVVTPRFDANNGTIFSDVWSTSYYSTPVRWAVSNGITNGTSTYTFSPNGSCSRAEMVTFLYRAAGSPSVGYVNNPFWDVQSGAWYYNAVMWAVSNGITNGVSKTQFGVNQPVSRAMAVTFLYRYAKSPAVSSNNAFYDVPSTEWYAKAVTWATNKGITNGYGNAYTFAPNRAVTRGEAVTFLYRDVNGIRA